MNVNDHIHAHFVAGRRVRVLCSHLSRLIPANSRVLDVGCGDGFIAWLLKQGRADINVQGIDVLVRPDAKISVQSFDGQYIPYKNGSFDVVILVDVLHHADNPLNLFAEVLRVSRHAVLIKDHILKGFLAGPTLRFMDRVGNARHGVELTYNYWTQERWQQVFQSLGVQVALWNQNLGLYPRPAKWVFERSLHFLALLKVGKRDVE